MADNIKTKELNMAATLRPSFALNQITTPGLDCRRFIDLAASLGCVGVELRNDLADKRLTSAAFFDGQTPEAIGGYANDKGIRLLGLSEAYGFNTWSDAMRAKVQLLIDQAVASGAETISLIPRNDAPGWDASERGAALREALTEILPMLAGTKLVALVEPLGFLSSSLRSKAETIAAIEAVGGRGRFKLVHDTFHHFLADGGPIFPEFTGVVHISGVVDPALTPEQMGDGDRILVDARDRLGNVAQIRAFLDAGFEGPFSFEPFSPLVHALADPQTAIAQSFAYIESAVTA